MRRMITGKQVEALDKLDKSIEVNENNITITVDNVPLEIKYQPISISFFNENLEDYTFNLPEVLLNIEGNDQVLITPMSIKPHVLTAEEVQGINAKHAECTVNFPCYTADINIKIYDSHNGTYTFFGKKAIEDDSSGFYPSKDKEWSNIQEGALLWVEFENIPAFALNI